ncbi:MAG: CcmD family protein [Bacillota bacterium]
MLFFQVAYVVLWVLLLGYTLYLGRRQRQVEAELERLSQVMASEPATRP